MLISTFADLIKLLESEKIPHHADEKLQFVEMPTHSPPLEGSMAIVWDRQENLVQFIYIYPFELPPDRVHAIEEAVARANHVLALPGFGIDHEKLRAYYRIVLPRAKDGSLDSTVIGPAIISVVDTTRDFLIPLRQIALNDVPPSHIVERARLSRRDQQ